MLAVLEMSKPLLRLTFCEAPVVSNLLQSAATLERPDSIFGQPEIVGIDVTCLFCRFPIVEGLEAIRP
jgi:hypothetical protein